MKIINYLSVIMTVVCLTGFAVMSAKGQVAVPAEPPSVTIPMSATAPTLNGALDEPCWSNAAVLSDFALVNSAQKPAKPTRVLLLRDSQWLYIGLDARVDNPQTLICKVKDHDGGVGQDESVEIFIDPGTDAQRYFHFMLNAANTRADQFVVQSSRDRGWNPPWKTSTRTNEAGWTAEMAIPLFLLASEGDMAKARMNIARNSAPESSTWAPTTSYHDPSRFGALKGLEGLRPTIPFVAFGNVQVRPYERAGGTNRYTVVLDVGAEPANDRNLRLLVEDQPVTGQGRTVTQEFTVARNTPQTLTVPVPVAARVTRTLLIRLQDAVNGNWLMSQNVTPDNLASFSAYLDRSFYTTEETAQVVCQMNRAPAELESLRIIVRDAGGREVGSSEAFAKPSEAKDAIFTRRSQPEAKEGEKAVAEVTIPLTLKTLPPGTVPLKVEFLDKSNEPVFTQDVSLVRRAPKPGREFKVDQINRVLLKDGRPFFPFGIILSMWKSDEIRDERHFQHAADMGFNTVLQWCGCMEPEDGRVFMEQAAKHNLNVLAWLAAYFTSTPMKGIETFLSPEAQQSVRKVTGERSVAGATKVRTTLMFDPALSKLSPEDKVRIFDIYYQDNLPRIIQAIDIMKDCPNLIGYKLYDEPPAGSYFRQYVHGRKLYQQAHESDGYHPIFLLFSSYIPRGDEYVDWTDCLGTDPYWVPGNRRADIRSTLQFVAKITALTDRRAAERRQVTWIVPLAEYWVAGSKRALTVPEQFSQTYLALIHGAKGLVYFRHPLRGRTMVEGFRQLSKQMEILGPLCLTPAIPQNVTYDAPFRPELNNAAHYPDVHAVLRRAPQEKSSAEGDYVLLAANARPYPVDATFEISLLGEKGKVKSLFSKATCPVKNGVFSERLEPTATRAYAFKSDNPIEGPVTIRVKTTPQPELVTPEYGVPETGRVGKKNLIPNPSFEEASFPGWPDYFICSTPGLGMDYYLGDPDARYSLDPSCPMEGKYAVKMVSRSHGGTWTMVEVRPTESKPTDYVFSAYMKADRDGMEAGWFAFNTPQKTVKLTREWKRYFIKGTVPFASSDNPLWGVRTDDVGTMWVDAIQLEKGAEPTTFEP